MLALFTAECELVQFDVRSESLAFAPPVLFKGKFFAVHQKEHTSVYYKIA
jgi:hypothetical protein